MTDAQQAKCQNGAKKQGQSTHTSQQSKAEGKLGWVKAIVLEKGCGWGKECGLSEDANHKFQIERSGDIPYTSLFWVMCPLIIVLSYLGFVCSSYRYYARWRYTCQTGFIGPWLVTSLIPTRTERGIFAHGGIWHYNLFGTILLSDVNQRRGGAGSTNREGCSNPKDRVRNPFRLELCTSVGACSSAVDKSEAPHLYSGHDFLDRGQGVRRGTVSL